MLRHILRNDWRNLRADRTLWAVALLLSALIAYAVHNGAAWVRFQSETLRGAVAEEAERLQAVHAGIEDANAGRTKPPYWRDPRSPYAVGNGLGARYVTMPPAPLAAFAVGQSDLLPYYFRVSLKSRDTLLGNDEIENPVHLLSGRFDLSFVVIYLFPLLILALSYNLVSGEKEDGVLAMTLSQPVSLKTLAWGKIAFRGGFTLAAATALSLAGAILSGVNLAAEGTLPRFALWTLAVAAYGAFWFALAAAVNAGGRSSAANAVILAGLWLAFVLLIPAVLNVAVKAVHPVPSRVEMIQAIRAASDDIVRQRSQVMAKYFEDHPEFAGGQDSLDPFALRNVVINDELNRRVLPVLAEFDRQLAAQQALVDRYRFLSPAILIQSVLYDLAGSGVSRYNHFRRLAEEFHGRWRGHFEPLVLKGAKLTTTDLNRIPQFQWREESLGEVARRVSGALAALLLLNLLAAALSLRALRRYPIAG
jgi:ABC-2 type transport system permease protein